MTVTETLDTLRRDLPGCTLVAYGDLDARLVLASSAATRHPREVLDALCLAADTCLSGPGARIAAQALGVPRLTRATALRQGRLSLFLRAEGDGGDALFCVFDAPTDAGAATARAQETLRDLARRS